MTAANKPAPADFKIAIYGCNEGDAGFGHVFINLINALGRRCKRLEVVTHQAEVPDYHKVNASIRRAIIGSGGGFKRARLLADYLRRENPDIVLCDSNREKSSRILLLARFLAGSRAKIVFRLGVPITRIMEQRNDFNAWFYLQSVKYTFSRADFVIANAPGVADDLVNHAHIDAAKISVVDNSTVASSIHDMAVETIKEDWCADPAVPVILSAGRLRKQKDFETLLRAFALVRAKRSCRLIILGEGSERRRLEELIDQLGVGGEALLPGHRTNPFAYMRRAALFVLSSRFEGSPNVLIEALALGVPVVATDCHSGPREILADGKYGPLVAVGDHVALATAILATLDHPLPAVVLQQSVTRYDADEVAKCYVEIFARLLTQ